MGIHSGSCFYELGKFIQKIICMFETMSKFMLINRQFGWLAIRNVVAEDY